MSTQRKSAHREVTPIGRSNAGKLEVELDFTKKVALVFGNEHNGVSEEARNLADGNFVIPQVGMIPSLNISVACAVSIYEAYRQRKEAGLYNQEVYLHPNADSIRALWSSYSAD